MTERFVGAAIAIFGGWFLWQAGNLREGPGYAAIGPRVFPVIIGVGLVLSGIAVLVNRAEAGSLVRLTAGADRHEAADEPIAWTNLTLLAACLAVYLATLLPLGFIVSSTLFMVGGARILGSRHWIRDLAVGVLLSTISYAVFTMLLGLELPSGPFHQLPRMLGGYAR